MTEICGSTNIFLPLESMIVFLLCILFLLFFGESNNETISTEQAKENYMARNNISHS
jgi:hypothetical protein